MTLFLILFFWQSVCHAQSCMYPAPDSSYSILLNGDSLKVVMNYRIGQTWLPIDVSREQRQAIQDSLDSICAKRSHIITYGSVTLMACYPAYIDLPDRTLRIYYDRNIMSGQCERCGRYVKESVMDKPDTTVIWGK